MTWAQRLKRVFNIDIETCRECGGAVKVIACIEDPVVIKKILDHLKEKGEYRDAFRLPESRGPPQTRLFGYGKSVREGQGRCRRHQARVTLGHRFRLGESQGRNPARYSTRPPKTTDQHLSTSVENGAVSELPAVGATPGFQLPAPDGYAALTIKDMIGSQATKGIHVLARFAPKVVECGVWSDGSNLTAIEAYPSACKRSETIQALRRPYSALTHADCEDALTCALVASLFAEKRGALQQPEADVSVSEGWIWVPRDAFAQDAASSDCT